MTGIMDIRESSIIRVSRVIRVTTVIRLIRSIRVMRIIRFIRIIRADWVVSLIGIAHINAQDWGCKERRWESGWIGENEKK
jgi:hypothetical protein